MLMRGNPPETGSCPSIASFALHYIRVLALTCLYMYIHVYIAAHLIICNLRSLLHVHMYICTAYYMYICTAYYMYTYTSAHLITCISAHLITCTSAHLIFMCVYYTVMYCITWRQGKVQSQVVRLLICHQYRNPFSHNRRP